MASQEEPVYSAKDALGIMTRYTLVTGGCGAFVAGIQNTLARQNVSAAGFFTKFGGTTATFAAMGAAYGFTKTVSANLREVDDPWNTAIGGFFAGSMIGLRARTMPAFVGYGFGLAVLSGTFDYCGNTLGSIIKKNPPDYLDHREYLRANRRRDVWESVSEMGEGRGIYGPGYEERRREKIRQNYGIEINPGVEASN